MCAGPRAAGWAGKVEFDHGDWPLKDPPPLGGARQDQHV